MTAAMNDQPVALGVKQSPAPGAHHRFAAALTLNFAVRRAQGLNARIGNLVPAECGRDSPATCGRLRRC